MANSGANTIAQIEELIAHKEADVMALTEAREQRDLDFATETRTWAEARQVRRKLDKIARETAEAQQSLRGAEASKGERLAPLQFMQPHEAAPRREPEAQQSFRSAEASRGAMLATQPFMQPHEKAPRREAEANREAMQITQPCEQRFCRQPNRKGGRRKIQRQLNSNYVNPLK
jgi:hypothetical protein